MGVIFVDNYQNRICKDISDQYPPSLGETVIFANRNMVYKVINVHHYYNDGKQWVGGHHIIVTLEPLCLKDSKPVIHSL